jgi:lipopolysaccharide/colanic/teichoic acid biosynthesis glycosyltransferase
LKRAIDVVLGFALLVLALPVIVLSWIAVRLTSAGPGLYSQVRVGLNGRQYRIYKIRTMYNDCERKSGARWCVGRDPRVTPLGRILRAFHLDELPQLWNVLVGDMSLIGPRPERPEFVKPLSETIPGYAARHLVRPGVTGLAQIQLPADSGIESVRTKLVLDRCYVEQGSIWLDTRIMLGTAIYLAGFSYGAVRKAMRLPNPLVEGQGGSGPVSPTSPTTRPHTTRSKKSSSSDRDPVACGKE